ncbi:helix-turn-helix transcriptional regulator [Desulfopila sp. IMCC35008]|uniref:helix-turn-helix transcriptional regulator n=1 Tax=Desulfopila sp. IMCC35008 TaxID=2653858 RepID=UPI0013D0FA3E|nr:helix-turn-helix domain-containing protein [Desulfopila sp. IMCC35008]
MIRIDGDRVKKLREQKGLTQLYVATAVQVTTDTISRWENKRYPTIKKENGIRLAEALEVELQDIVDTQPDIATKADEHNQTTKTDNKESQPYKRTFRWKNFIFLTGSALFLAIAGVLAFFYLTPQIGDRLSADRILPSHCIPGQPFPVTIEINGSNGQQISLIVKEQIPENIAIHATQPQAPPVGNSAKNSLRWIGRISRDSQYIYIASITDDTRKITLFSGTFAVSTDKGKTLPITGSDQIITGSHHWADIDKDNIINDTEILTVYDRYGEFEPLREDIDRIEEIWLGSGYRWNEQKKEYEILP